MRAAKFIPPCEKIVFYGNADRDWKGRNMDKKHLYNVLVFLYYYLIAAYVAVYYRCFRRDEERSYNVRNLRAARHYLDCL